MKILAFTPFPPEPGGGSRVSEALFKRLSERGHEIFVITYRKYNKEDTTSKVFALNLKKSFVGFRGFLYILWGSLTGIYVGMKNNVNIVYGRNLSSPGITATIVAKSIGRPLVLHTAGQDVQSPEKGVSRKNIFTMMITKVLEGALNIELKMGDLIIAVCKTDGKVVSKLVGSSKVVTQYYGIDTDKFSPNVQNREKIRKMFGLGNDETIFCFSGRPSKEKGIAILLKLAKKFDDSYFLFIGPTNNKVKSFGEITSNCIFTGFVDNVCEYLQASDIFLLPSEIEGVPNAMVEAMSCNLPVISTPVGDCKYLIEDGKNGFLVNDVNGFIEKCKSLKKNRKLRESMGYLGRKKVLELFDWDLMVDTFENCFEKLIVRPSERRVINQKT